MISDVPSIKFKNEPLNSDFSHSDMNEMNSQFPKIVTNSAKRFKESPFNKNEQSDRRQSRFSRLTTDNDNYLQVAGRGRNSPSMSPNSPYSKKVSTQSSEAVIELPDIEDQSNEDEITDDYRAQFEREELRNKKKYLISAGAKEIIVLMDKIIKDKILEGKGLRNKRESIENSFSMSNLARTVD